MSIDEEALAQLGKRVRAGGAEKYHAANRARGKLFARERVALLLDEDSFVEDGLFANVQADGLPADGVITGFAHRRRAAGLPDGQRLDRQGGLLGRPHRSRRSSGSSRRPMPAGVPMVYLVDSAGARITDQVDLFPGRRGAGKIFHTQVRACGSIPQACALFGPSAAGGAYIPAFCDIVAMVEGNASMYLGSDRMVEMVTGEKTTLEAMGGARVHCAESGVGHFLCKTEAEAIETVRRYLSYLPSNWTQPPPVAAAAADPRADLGAMVPASERQAFDMRRYVRGLLDADSYFEIQALWARELTVGFGRLDGKAVGVVANNSMFKGGVLFVDSADKATRFIQLCDAFNVPLLFLADVPGFMVGSTVEKQGIIRHGAKMITAVSEATVPKICVVVRKAYGAGLYAMAGPGFEPDATIALPTAKIAVMGAEAAVNAVYANKIAALPEDERAGFVAAKREEYERDIDVMRLASELVIDAVIEPAELRDELIRRFRLAEGKHRNFSMRRHGVTPV